MEFNEYINWVDLWGEELKTNTEEDYSLIENSTLDGFRKEKGLILSTTECYVDFESKTFNLFFSKSGGQNESDNQGWYISYCLVFDADYTLKDISYEQG